MRPSPKPPSSKLLSLAAALVFAASHLPAQSAPPAVKLPGYDVVSIKPNRSGSGHVGVHTRDSTYQAENVSLKNLLLNAYNLKEAQLVDLPPWGESERFDINAKVLDPDMTVLNDLSEQQRGSMLQAMLADRFGLKSHMGTAILPVYELVLLKGGPRFKPAQNTGRTVKVHNTELTATGVPLATLVDELSSELGRVVVDKTGLTGNFDITLKWSKDDAAATDTSPPTLLTALQEQLGLKLVPSKAPIPTFVIDHVEMPSEN